MTRKQDNAREQSWKEQLAGQEDFMKSVVQAVLQQVLEQEMEEPCRPASTNGPRSDWATGRGPTAGR